MAWVTGTPTPSSAGPSQATSPTPDVRTVLTYVSLSTGISCHPVMRACPAVQCRGPAPRHHRRLGPVARRAVRLALGQEPRAGGVQGRPAVAAAGPAIVEAQPGRAGDVGIYRRHGLG